MLLGISYIINHDRNNSNLNLILYKISYLDILVRELIKIHKVKISFNFQKRKL